MAYVAVKGGQQAIKEAEKLLNYYRLRGGSDPLKVDQIKGQLRLAVDKVMGEGSLYGEELAALALKQAEGDTIEASFMMRAFRSTLPRNHYSIPVDTTDIQPIRRISAAFKNIPGGQYLGPTKDYTKRMFDFELMEESEQHVKEFLEGMDNEGLEHELDELPNFPKVIDLLKDQGLVEEKQGSVTATGDIEDITRKSIQFPASRAVRLQAMARGETGAMMMLAYSSARGYGSVHPTLGELRVGYVPVTIPHPVYEGERITIGKIMISEAEIIAKLSAGKTKGKEETTAGSASKEKAQYTIGYGLCFGQNEVKVMAMATLDRAMEVETPTAPAEDEEFVLYHIDGIEASGFVSHWKLPHYVTFQAGLSRLRSIQEREGQHNEGV